MRIPTGRFPSPKVSSFDRVGELYALRGDFKMIKRIFEKALAEDDLEPNDRLALLERLGPLHEVLGDFHAMVQTYRTLADMTDASTTNSWSWYRLGIAYHALGNYDMAIEAYAKSNKMGGAYWNELRDAYEAKARTTDTKFEFTEFALTEKFPHWQPMGWSSKLPPTLVEIGVQPPAPPLYDYATITTLFLSCDRALKFLEILIERDSSEGWAWNLLGDILCYRGDLPGAIEAYKSAIRNPYPYAISLSHVSSQLTVRQVNSPPSRPPRPPPLAGQHFQFPEPPPATFPTPNLPSYLLPGRFAYIHMAHTINHGGNHLTALAHAEIVDPYPHTQEFPYWTEVI